MTINGYKVQNYCIKDDPHNRQLSTNSRWLAALYCNKICNHFNNVITVIISLRYNINTVYKTRVPIVYFFRINRLTCKSYNVDT